jgi:hypothetical protein
MPSDVELAPERFDIVAGGSANTDSRDPKGTKDAIHKRVAVAAVLRVVRPVVKFYDRNDGGGETVVDDKVHMLLAQAPAVDGIPQFRPASDDVRKTGFHGDTVPGSDGPAERAIECKLATRKQRLSPLIGKCLPGLLGKLWRPASAIWALRVLS